MKTVVAYIPKHLTEEFENFVSLAIGALESCSDRKDWSDGEREIVDWLEHDKYKGVAWSKNEAIQSTNQTTSHSSS